MLKRLTIENYALIKSLDIEFPDGLIIITGETGAGKSILLGAISLLLGGKSKSSVFMDDTKNCIVEAEFDDDRILRRVISPSGRSRAFYNDEPVKISYLSELSSKFIDIHEQHQHLKLSDELFRLSVLDKFAQDDKELHDFRNKFEKHNFLLSELKKLEEKIRKSESEKDFKTFQYQNLVEAKLELEEVEKLEAEQTQLANAENIKLRIEESINSINPFEHSIVQQIKDAITPLEKEAEHLPALQSIIDRLDSCKYELDDIDAELNKLSDSISVSPQRLEEVDNRLSTIYTLEKKHNVTSVEELIEIRDALASELEASDISNEKLESLKKEVSNAMSDMREASVRLSKKRHDIAPIFSSKLQEIIRSLEMPYATFRIDITDKQNLTVNGQDTVDFKFSANGSYNLNSISNVASGGELSRIMLSLKSLMAGLTYMPTMIFDEIDTGVSGKIADKMGNLIGNMAENMQIFAITHLPQIASKAGAHYLVYKEMDDNNIAHTYIKKLNQEEREREVARMLSGAKLTDAALVNAKELMKNY